MQDDEFGDDGQASERISGEANGAESAALGPFISAVGQCAELLVRIRERVDDHLGISPDAVTWGHVGDVNRVLLHLRHAALAERDSD